MPERDLARISHQDRKQSSGLTVALQIQLHQSISFIQKLDCLVVLAVLLKKNGHFGQGASAMLFRTNQGQNFFQFVELAERNGMSNLTFIKRIKQGFPSRFFLHVAVNKIAQLISFPAGDCADHRLLIESITNVRRQFSVCRDHFLRRAIPKLISSQAHLFFRYADGRDF